MTGNPPLRPRDLPELRLRLLREWGPRGEFTMMSAMPYDTRFLGDPRFSHLEGPFDARTLAAGDLWYVDETMSELVAHAAKSLPATTLTEELVPRRPVVAYFATPLQGMDGAIEGMPLEIRLIAWARRSRFIDNLYEPVVTAAMYGPSVIDGWLEDLLLPMGRTDWRLGTDTDEVTFPSREDDDDVRRAKSMEEDRRWLAALWLLTSQPLASSELLKMMNKSRRRRLQAQGDLSTDVRLWGLRQPEQSQEPPEAGSGSKWGHRTIVGAATGGFWRQVAYGPGRSLRRPKWIFPYEAGPKDGPLIIREKVSVVRGRRKP